MALIKYGHRYLCIQTLVMDMGTVSFKFGHVYEPYPNGGDSLRNEQGECHGFSQDFFVQHFVDVTNVVSVEDFVL